MDNYHLPCSVCHDDFPVGDLREVPDWGDMVCPTCWETAGILWKRAEGFERLWNQRGEELKRSEAYTKLLQAELRGALAFTTEVRRQLEEAKKP